jgi:hypothetical protein
MSKKTAEAELLDRLSKQFDDAAKKESHKTFMKRTKKAIAKLRDSRKGEGS